MTAYLYDNRGVKVTSDLLDVGGRRYSLREISTLGIEKEYDSPKGSYGMIAIAVACFGATLTTDLKSYLPLGSWILVPGCAVLATFLAALRLRALLNTPAYKLVLAVGHHRVSAFKTRDRGEISQLVEVITSAKGKDKRRT